MPYNPAKIFTDQPAATRYSEPMNLIEQIINAIGAFLKAIVDLFVAFLKLIVDFFENLFSIFA